jgi:hypothetical protein
MYFASGIACSCTGNSQNTSIQNSTNLTHVESNSEDDGDQHDGEANDAGKMQSIQKLLQC